MSIPSLREFIDAASAVYSRFSPSLPENGWKILSQSAPTTIADGFYATAYEDEFGNVIIAYDGTEFNNSTIYGHGTLLADRAILTGQPSVVFTYANTFASTITAAFPALHVYVTGHSLGGTEAEATILQNSDILGGATFGAPALPNSDASRSNFQEYVDEGDIVGNFAGDGTNSIEASLVRDFLNQYHVGHVDPVGAAHAQDLNNLETSIANLLGDTGRALLTLFTGGTLSFSTFLDFFIDSYSAVQAAQAVIDDHHLATYASDLNLQLSDLISTTADTVGASVSHHGNIQVNATPISGTIDSVDESYDFGLGSASAGTIISTGALAGTPVDKDWYLFNTIAGAVYTVTAGAQNMSSGRIALSIKNSTGNTVDVNQIGNTSDDVVDSPTGTSTITFTATGSQYYAAVSAGGADGIWQFAAGDYTIGVNKLASPSAVSVSDVTISEGDSGTKIATFTVTRTGGTAAFDVNFTTADGSATVADGDYVATMGTLHFGTNVNTQTIPVTINGDTKVEPDQTFLVLLSGATNGASITDNQGIGTISNDDANHAPTVTITTTGGLTASAAQTISGTVDVADAGTTVTVFDGANNIGTAIVAPNGTWTANVTLSVQGPNTLVAKDTNGSGTGISNSIFYTLDTATYSLTPSNPTVPESQESLVFTLTRTNETDAATVFVQTDETHGSQNPNSKYFNEQNLVAVPFAQYASSATFSVTINDIHATSGTQTFGVSIYPSLSASGTPLATTTFTINDTDTNTGPLTGNIIFDDTVTGTTTISTLVNIFNGATLQNNGVIYINSGGAIGGDNSGGIVSNTAGSVINIDTADTPSAKTIDVTRVNNNGTIIVSPGSGNVATIWTTNGGISDNGAIQVLSGTLQLHMFGASSTATLNASQISVAASAGLLFTGAGTFTLSGGSYNVAGTTTIGTSTFSANVAFGAGTTVNVGNAWSIQNGSVDFSAATLLGTFESLDIGPNASNLNFGANSITINNLTTYLQNITDSGTITLSGSIVSDATWLGAGTIVNEGAISPPVGWQPGLLGAGETLVNHGSITNIIFSSGDVINNKPDGVMTLFGAAAGATVNNEGQIHFSGPGSGNGQVSGALNNSGTVEFSSTSGWNLGGGGTSSASGLVVDAGITLFFSGNGATVPYTITGGTFDGGGNLWIVSGAKVKFASSTQVDLAFHNDGTIEVVSGSLTLEQALTGTGSVTMDAGTTLALAAPQSFTNKISGFASGDIIDLVGVAATGVSVNASDQLVVTDAGTTVAALQLIGSYPGVGLQFLLAPDGAGGTKITLGAPSAPTVNAGAVAVFVDSNSPVAVPLDDALSVLSGGNPTLASATVSVSSGFHAGDILAATTAGTGIAATYNTSTGVLTLSGNDTPANYESVLKSVTFDSDVNAQQNGTDPTRTIGWVANDGTHVSAAATSTVTIIDAAPTLTVTTTPTRAGGASAPVTLDPALIVSDIDNASLVGATVSIVSGFHEGDLLGVTTTGTAITVASNIGGTLTLAGTDTIAHYQSALRSVTFATTDMTEDTRITVWTVNDGSQASALAAHSVDLSLSQIGGPGNDTLVGGPLDDTLDGGAGADTMSGGLGNDTYVVDNAGDQVVENPNAGYDTVFASISYTLPANVEEVVLTGTANLNAVANTLDDTLVGNDGDNQFTVGPGTDIIIGHGGNDTVVFSGHKADYAISKDNIDTQSFSVTDLRSGSPDGVNIVSEVEFFKFSDGTVDTASFSSPTVTNPDNTKTVTTYDTGNLYPWSSTVSTYDTAGHLAAQTYNEDNGSVWTNAYDTNNAFNWAWSASNYDGSGNFISKTTTYDDGTHSLTAHDTLGTNDWSDLSVTFDASWNVVSESGTHHDGTALAAAEIGSALDAVSWYMQPVDPVRDFALPSTVDPAPKIETPGPANVIGDSGNNTISGGPGDDTLDGGPGADTMSGGPGNDSYVVDNVGDQVVENANAGYDTVFASVSYTLPANVEEVVLTGTGNLNAMANTLDDTLVGNAGDNQFTVGPGTDIILGGAGNDTVVFSGHQADYAIAFDNDTQRFTVSDLRSGSSDGASIISEVESFQFTDATLSTTSLLSPTVTNPDSTKTVTTYDTGNLYPWSSTVSTYDAAGHLAVQTYNEDNGSVWTNAYDTNNAFNWNWSTSNYDVSGILISKTTTFDDGTHSLAVHDAAGANDWADFTVAFDANWNVVSEGGTRHDGTTIPTGEISATLDTVSWYGHPVDPAKDFLLS